MYDIHSVCMNLYVCEVCVHVYWYHQLYSVYSKSPNNNNDKNINCLMFKEWRQWRNMWAAVNEQCSRYPKSYPSMSLLTFKMIITKITKIINITTVDSPASSSSSQSPDKESRWYLHHSCHQPCQWWLQLSHLPSGAGHHQCHHQSNHQNHQSHHHQSHPNHHQSYHTSSQA